MGKGARIRKNRQEVKNFEREGMMGSNPDCPLCGKPWIRSRVVNPFDVTQSVDIFECKKCNIFIKVSDPFAYRQDEIQKKTEGAECAKCKSDEAMKGFMRSDGYTVMKCRKCGVRIAVEGDRPNV